MHKNSGTESKYTTHWRRRRRTHALTTEHIEKIDRNEKQQKIRTLWRPSRSNPADRVRQSSVKKKKRKPSDRN